MRLSYILNMITKNKLDKMEFCNKILSEIESKKEYYLENLYTINDDYEYGHSIGIIESLAYVEKLILDEMN